MYIRIYNIYLKNKPIIYKIYIYIINLFYLKIFIKLMLIFYLKYSMM